MRIRKMKEDEIKETLTIEQKELYPELTSEQMRSWVEGKGPFAPQCFVAEKDSTIVGFIVLSPYEVRNKEVLLEISTIAVRSENQRQGIGKNLIEASLSEVKNLWSKEGFRVVGLLVETGEDEEEAIAFYEKILPSFQKRIFREIWEDEKGIVFYLASFILKT
ncbi:hypothetical protein AMJ50_01205 [Parcubacteria bacterium DG_74_3]|nr:MAG: hypothetical protein AMJ50_01205 [Parcubacteria bacterium DG_74_3]